eukprot:1607314-Pleurochrysis_carterae.AAC.1
MEIDQNIQNEIQARRWNRPTFCAEDPVGKSQVFGTRSAASWLALTAIGASDSIITSLVTSRLIPHCTNRGTNVRITTRVFAALMLLVEQCTSCATVETAPLMPQAKSNPWPQQMRAHLQTVDAHVTKQHEDFTKSTRGFI